MHLILYGRRAYVEPYQFIIQQLISAVAGRSEHGRYQHVEPMPSYRFSVVAYPTVVALHPYCRLKTNSRVRSRHAIVPSPLVCNNMNAVSGSRNRAATPMKLQD
jgi:hypothetical protein